MKKVAIEISILNWWNSYSQRLALDKRKKMDISDFFTHCCVCIIEEMQKREELNHVAKETDRLEATSGMIQGNRFHLKCNKKGMFPITSLLQAPLNLPRAKSLGWPQGPWGLDGTAIMLNLKKKRRMRTLCRCGSGCLTDLQRRRDAQSTLTLLTFPCDLTKFLSDLLYLI